jgi:hypothetical protein
MNLLLVLTLLAQDPFRVAPRNYKLEFENQWVRVVRVRYGTHDKTAVHDHPATPAVYVYVTDGGRLKITHAGDEPVIRPAVQAGAIRYSRGMAEHHSVEELDGIATEFLRVELLMKPVDLPERDVRRAPDDRTPYESKMIRILRVTCAPRTSCPQSDRPENPAVVIIGRDFQWQDPGLQLSINGAAAPMEQVRIELVSKPE